MKRGDGERELSSRLYEAGIKMDEITRIVYNPKLSDKEAREMIKQTVMNKGRL